MATGNAPVRVPWACPKCGAKAHEHGNGGGEGCRARRLGNASSCDGFICECEVLGEEEDHGERFDRACLEAVCTHCGWHGVFPVRPKKMQAWEKKALAAGWSPPDVRRKELGL